VTAATILVEWRDGQQAEVSRELYEWIVASVPEAATADARARLYEIGYRLSRMVPAVGDSTAETDQERIARRNAASKTVVDAWDRLMQAMADHPTYRGDQHDACERAGVNMTEAEKYAIALRGVIDGYRTPARAPKGGRPPRLRMLWLAEYAEQIMPMLGIGEQRAAAVICGVVKLVDVTVDAETLRQTMRNRRVRNG